MNIRCTYVDYRPTIAAGGVEYIIIRVPYWANSYSLKVNDGTTPTPVAFSAVRLLGNQEFFVSGRKIELDVVTGTDNVNLHVGRGHSRTLSYDEVVIQIDANATTDQTDVFIILNFEGSV